MNRRVTRGDHAFGAGLGALYVVLLMATASDIGLSRDEGIYVVAAETYARWFDRLLEDPAAAVERASVDRHWGFNHEHPSLAKATFALGHMVQQSLGIFGSESLSFRFAGMLSAGLLLWLLYVFGVRAFGRRAGLFAALAYGLLPRPFYHAHLDAFDVPITLMVTWVVYTYWRSLLQRRWALWCGVAFGFALATKHNSWMLPGICLIHFAAVLIGDRLRLRSETSQRVARTPWWFIAMLAIGPLFFVASWPWLWFDSWDRFNAYASFHLKHEYYNMAYFGVNHFWPPFPISFPWVMTLYTVPLTTLLLAVVGFWREAAALIGVARRLRSGDRALEFDPRLTSLLMFGCVVAPLLAISLPSTPIFGGTKHWFTAYPFMALFAGMAFDRLVDVLGKLRPGLGRSLPVLCGGLLLTPAALETAHSHPFGLSHYGVAAGGVAGAADRGMNRQFWGFTTGSLAGYFTEQLPLGGKVWICDTIGPAFKMLARDGLMPETIVATPHIAEADFAIVHHEHHFAEVDHQIWTTFGSVQPAHVLLYDGVPIISVYRNPRSTTANGPR